ncbi:hypothetical protein [Pseudonocardia sp. KRD291]|uniref:hypothetical protein n=1 Tax=Pseudonocardia sp. KRD291 TaxID=2792007 RepID=UPI001C4A3FB2|nr:hypothetical protein [Pseudonocardia sp. KRD291]MBW0102800.1 hypothetical protein [Pseudonocardia sp. KRD291]
MTIRVAALHIADASRAPMRPVDRVEAEAGLRGAVCRILASGTITVGDVVGFPERTGAGDSHGDRTPTP